MNMPTVLPSHPGSLSPDPAKKTQALEAIKAQIANGQYHVNAETLAKLLLQKGLLS